MSLATLVLAIFLILLGLTWVGWVAVSTVVLGIFALAAGVLMLLEGLDTFSYRIGDRR